MPVRFNVSTDAGEAADQPKRASCGSYAKVAAMLDELADRARRAGAMMTFDDFVIGMEQFGTRIQPLMTKPPPDSVPCSLTQSSKEFAMTDDTRSLAYPAAGC